MSGRNKNNITLTQHGVVTQEAMLAYLAGMLSVEDTARFEQLIAEDPFAHEALEGLQGLQSSNGLKQTLHEINTQVQEQTGGKVTPMPASGSILRYSVAAAVVGVLIGFGFMLTQYFSNQTNSLAENAKQEEPIALEQPAAPAANEQIVPAIDTAATTDTTLTTETINANGMAMAESETDDAEVVTKPGSMTAVSKENTVTYKWADTEEQGKKKAETTAEKKLAEAKDKSTAFRKQEEVSKRPANAPAPTVAAAKAVAPPAGTYKAVADEAVATDAVSGEESSEKDATIETAMTSFNTKKYGEAAKQFHKLLKKQPDNPDVLYFGGVSEYINGNSNKALSNFDKLLSSGNKYTDGAKWYKSQILLQKGKKDQAKQLMKELSTTNSIYRERSVQKLEELNK